MSRDRLGYQEALTRWGCCLRQCSSSAEVKLRARATNEWIRVLKEKRRKQDGLECVVSMVGHGERA